MTPRIIRIAQIALFCVLGGSSHLHALSLPVTAAQKATASLIAQTGVALDELAPHAPASYTVKRGDTLWSVSAIYLKGPWRWPELWGMNLQDIRNPHLIYTGQQLFLDTSSGRALLRTGHSQTNTEGPPTESIRISPRTRSESLADASVPALASSAIEPFLVEPLIVDEATFANAPRIVAAQEGRVLLTRGDRAYARAQSGTGKLIKPLSDVLGEPSNFRIFRGVTALKDPSTGVVLGYEAQYVGKATLVRGENLSQTTQDGKLVSEIVPATIDITLAKEEIRVGDRLLAEPARELVNYIPHAPASKVEGQIVSVYGSAVRYAAANQVVAINRGRQDGMERGHVMALLKDGETLKDRTDASRPLLKLPNERNGLLMVFRTFDRLSYALVLQITDGAKVGDRFTNPN